MDWGEFIPKGRSFRRIETQKRNGSQSIGEGKGMIKNNILSLSLLCMTNFPPHKMWTINGERLNLG